MSIFFYLFVPAFIFVNPCTTNFSVDMLKVVLFCILYMITNIIIGGVAARFRKYDKAMSGAFNNSIIFNNSGNIGLSLVTLIFSSAPFVIDGKTPYLNIALAFLIKYMQFDVTAVPIWNALVYIKEGLCPWRY